MTDTQRRQQILKKIYRVPSDKLEELDDFVSKLEQNSDKKVQIMSFAGAWQNIDDSVFKQLTGNLINNRQRNKRRTNEQSSCGYGYSFRKYLEQFDLIEISLITYYEIVSGLLAKNALKQLNLFDEFISGNLIVPMTEKSARISSELYSALKQSGKIVDDVDLLPESLLKMT